MKLVFAHDHIFRVDKFGNYYTGGSFNNQVWIRYLKHFEEITVLARLQKLQDKNKNKIYNHFDLNETKFVPVLSLSGPIKQFTNKKNAERIIRQVLMEADFLIARLPSEIGNLAIDVAKEMGKSYMVEVVACVWDALWNYGGMSAKIYAPIAMHKMKKRVSHAPYVVYVTNRFLQERYPSKGKTVGISDVEINDIYKESIEIRSWRMSELKDRTFQIGMIGSLKNRIKGWDIAFKALSKLSERNINFEFNILGDGAPEQWLALAQKLNIADKVKFCGVLSGGEPVFKWLDNMDVYIQPSFQEGLPRAVIEAMSRGCPVAASNVGGIPELIDSSCTHKVGDFESLARCIEEIILDNDYYMQLAKKNIETAKKYRKSLLDLRREQFFNEIVEKLSI